MTLQFFDAQTYYKNISKADQYQFFLSDGDKVQIYSQDQQNQVVKEVNNKLKDFDKIIHSVYVLSDLDIPWQRKMLTQQYQMANQLNAKYYVFHLKESKLLYKHLNSLIQENKLNINSGKCRFALELTSKRIKHPKEYMKQIQNYRQQGATSVLDIAHVVSSGIYKLIPDKGKYIHKSNSLSNKEPQCQKKVSSNGRDNRCLSKQRRNYTYDPNHNQLVQRVDKFIKKYGNNFDILHFADQAVQVDIGKDVHGLPFTSGSLFSFNNIFTSIDLLDTLIQQYSLFVIEFIDQDRLFRRSLIRYFDKQLVLKKDLISYYVQILRWHADMMFYSDFDINGLQFQINSYESLAQQLIDIYRQPGTDDLQMNSPLWRKYCIPHKISQLLLIVDLSSYFLINSIKPPWDTRHPRQDDIYNPGQNELSRQVIESYIKKFIKMKLIKSKSQVYGSYIRGNQLIGDVDILIDIKQKERCLLNLLEHTKTGLQSRKKEKIDKDALREDLLRKFPDDSSSTKEYSIVKLYLDNQLNVDLYFTQTPNPVMDMFLTGSRNFNIFMRKRAQMLGFKLTNTQLLKKADITRKDIYGEPLEGDFKPVHIKTQSEIFKKLQMNVVPPKFRVFSNDTQQQYILK